MKLHAYAEMKDTSNNDEWSNKIDVYGYENRVLVMTMGFIKEYPVNNVAEAVTKVDEIITKLYQDGFSLLAHEIN